MCWVSTNSNKTKLGNNMKTCWEATCSSISASEAPPRSQPLATDGNACFEVGCVFAEVLPIKLGSALRSLLGEGSLVLWLLGALGYELLLVAHWPSLLEAELVDGGQRVYVQTAMVFRRKHKLVSDYHAFPALFVRLYQLETSSRKTACATHSAFG